MAESNTLGCPRHRADDGHCRGHSPLGCLASAGLPWAPLVFPGVTKDPLGSPAPGVPGVRPTSFGGAFFAF